MSDRELIYEACIDPARAGECLSRLVGDTPETRMIRQVVDMLPGREPPAVEIWRALLSLPLRKLDEGELLAVANVVRPKAAWFVDLIRECSRRQPTGAQ